jgi:hypothetical protein
MAQNTTNILVGAANLSVGTYSSDWNGQGDTLWNQIKQLVPGKDFRTWATASAAQTVTITGAVQIPLGGGTNVAGVGSCVFKDVGLTQEGVEVQYQPDFGEVEVDQLLDAAKLFKQKMTVSVATTFAESTLDNLMTVWAQASGTQYTDTGTSTSAGAVRMSGGALGEAPIEKALFFVGNAPGANATTYRQRVYLATRALSVEASSHALRRSEATVFPVTFRLLPDTAASYSAYGRVVDVS